MGPERSALIGVLGTLYGSSWTNQKQKSRQRHTVYTLCLLTARTRNYGRRSPRLALMVGNAEDRHLRRAFAFSVSLVVMGPFQLRKVTLAEGLTVTTSHRKVLHSLCAYQLHASNIFGVIVARSVPALPSHRSPWINRGTTHLPPESIGLSKLGTTVVMTVRRSSASSASWGPWALSSCSNMMSRLREKHSSQVSHQLGSCGSRPW